MVTAKLILISIVVLWASTIVSGCADQTPIPPLKITPPLPATMVPPARLPDLPKGAELKQLADDDIRCRRQYGHESDKLRSLQSYAAAITKG